MPSGMQVPQRQGGGPTLPGHTLLRRLAAKEALACPPPPPTATWKRQRGPIRLQLHGKRRKARLLFEGQQKGPLSLQPPSTPGSDTHTGRASIHSTYRGRQQAHGHRRKPDKEGGVQALFKLEGGTNCGQCLYLCVLKVLIP